MKRSPLSLLLLGALLLLTSCFGQKVAGEADAVRLVAASNTRSVNVVYGDKSLSTSLYGITPEWFEIRDWGVARGRLLDESDLQLGAKRCLIGHTLVRELFGDQDPLGAELRVTFDCERDDSPPMP